MKLTVLLTAFLGFAGVISAQGFYIKGNIKRSENSTWHPTVYLLKINNLNQVLSGSAQLVADSAVIAPDGSFVFSNAEAIEDNAIYRLNVIKKGNVGNGGALHMIGTTEGFAFFVLNKHSQIEFTTNIERFNYALHPIKIDEANQSFIAFHKMRNPINEQLDILIQKKAGLDTLAIDYDDSLKAVRDRIINLLTGNFDTYKKFADTVHNPYAAALASAFFDKKDTVFAQKLAKRFLKEIPGSRYSEQYIAALKEEAMLKIGTRAPEINMRDINGNPFSLSQHKGKYVFVDFWASWCLPCRAENKQTLRPLYEKVNMNDIVFISISQDINEKNWKKALEEDKINLWINACDNKGPMSKAAIDYNVTGLPSNYLINPDGIIVAKNLRSSDLEKAIMLALSYKSN